MKKPCMDLASSSTIYNTYYVANERISFQQCLSIKIAKLNIEFISYFVLIFR